VANCIRKIQLVATPPAAWKSTPLTEVFPAILQPTETSAATTMGVGDPMLMIKRGGATQANFALP